MMGNVSVKNIVCFGDSNTYAYDSSSLGRFARFERYPGILQEILGDDYYVIEEGLCGRTTSFEDPLTESLSGVSMVTPILRTHGPVDLLIIMLGTNDVKARFNAMPANIATALNRLIVKAQTTTNAWRDDKPQILIVCPPPIGKTYEQKMFGSEMGPGCSEKSAALAPLYKNVAELTHCHFLDGGSVDGVVMGEACEMHLSKEAHAALAQALAERIRQIL